MFAQTSHLRGMRILIVNGPNLDLLGSREPHIYGNRSFESYLAELRAAFPAMDIQYFQSNMEGEIVGALRDRASQVHGFILNAGGYSHTSVAIRDALAAVAIPFIEVHLSNIHRREAFRHHSYLSELAVGVVAGLGPAGYRYALQYALENAKPAA